MDVLGKDDLVASLVKEASLTREKADKALRSALQNLREALIAGRQIVLPDFATIHIAQQKAQIVRDPKTGHQYIKPAAKYLAITPEGDFQKEIDNTRLASILLAIPRNDSFSKVVEFHFSRVGWKVIVANSTSECVDVLKDDSAYLCIVDYGMKDAQTLIRDLKVNQQTSHMPVIVLFPSDRDPERSDEFRVCGDEHLVEPFEVYTLLTLAENELARSSEEVVIFDQQVCLQFPTSEQYIEEASQLIHDLLGNSGLVDDQIVAVNAAFKEAVLNAAQHGNRYDSHKQIKVLYLLDKEKVTLVVTDEGRGFNHSIYLRRSEAGDAVSAARERYEQGRLGGLGIMLMLRCTDKLEYNEQGNIITLTKYLKKS